MDQRVGAQLLNGGPSMHCTPSLGAEQSPRLARRSMLTALALAVPAAAFAQAPPGLTRRGTPQLTLGPFYPLDRPAEQDADLTRMAGRPAAQGLVIDIAGLVTDEAGRPVPGALLDVWQTNALGAYHHPSDPSGAPVDPGFQGSAVLRTDAAGAWRIRTVLPGPYADRVRHIHYDVRGRKRRLLTQMFFPGEPNERDPVLNTVAQPEVRRRVVAALADTPFDAGVPLYRFTIALSGE
jgi:protocatechuate 3,4-dioxygenase beta subunit